MENTLKTNTHVFVMKCFYGAKLPTSTYEIPYFSSALKLFKRISLWSDSRLPGFGDIERGDIALIKLKSWNQNLIKRVVAIPNDTILMHNGLLFVNSIPERIGINYKFNYVLQLNDREIETVRKFCAISYNGKSEYEAQIAGEDFNKLFDFFRMHDFKAKRFDVDSNSVAGIFPKSMRGNWDRNNYGMLVVPKKGMKILLSNENLNLYRETIDMYENAKIDQNNFGYTVNGAKQEFYSFKNDYYFMMGDNRMESQDSRFHGFFPRKEFYGKVID